VGFWVGAHRPLTPACQRLVDYLKQIAAQRAPQPGTGG
jgi:NAD-dependent oxidoreductase involved in siderophore biosynthesis